MSAAEKLQPLYYFVQPNSWGISDSEQNPEATTKGFNDALKYASQQAFPRVFIPKGVYSIDAVGEDERSPEYGGGISVPGNMGIVMHPEAIFKISPNRSQGYSCFYIGQVENVILSGGQIIGDRDQHDYYVPDGSIRKTHEWGFGIHIHGSQNVEIDNVRVSECTGDNIWIAAKGMMNWSTEYIPARSVTVRRCILKRGRRNNLATNGCEGLLVENNDIEEAGGSEIGPQLGIDLEGYGDKGIKYDHPYKLRIVGNRFSKNGRGAFRAHTSGKVIAKGNFSDDVFSYGFSTDVTIKDNHIINESDTPKEYGIDSIGVSSTESGNRANISGNTISGFKTGICARGKGITVADNTLENITAVGIHAYLSDDVHISDNRIDSNCIHFQVLRSKDVKIDNNKSKGAIDKYTLKLMNAASVSINGNKTEGYGGLYCESSTSVRAFHNEFNLTGAGYGVYWGKDCDVHLDGNWIIGARGTPIAGNADQFVNSVHGNRIIDCKAIIGVHLVGGRAHSLSENIVKFNRSTDQGYGFYLSGTDGARLIRNDVQVVNDKKIIHSFYTEKATNTSLMQNTYSGGTVKTAAGDTLRE
ncbi:right-handed parallel beta-helix repeat-containing protein [Bacillus atrophaeus]|uniref:right-handed parallel beta-helix repeat-containing protein n=1 Tax=Bacillus atrophaeus TaxID=1452 RepID=UPI00227F15AA|nr:right-handed parallel beta-helix repeat-containing protein [Bacillus atrophaeus]MCY9198109.1 right-handed parallel beta-helix repeat-containing protein [Bacillus atrophaeus]